MIYTLSVFNTGQITLPKKIREEKFHNSKKLLAEETADGLLIKPIKLEKDAKHRASKIVVMTYESAKEEGLIFPNGIAPQDLINLLEKEDE